jgi:hypothetical protein
MKMRDLQLRIGIDGASLIFACLVLVSAIAIPTLNTQAGTGPTYSISLQAISSAGSMSLRSGCFLLADTVGQPAPGYSSGSTDSLLAGFLAMVPTAGSDEIFFNGFEGC